LTAAAPSRTSIAEAVRLAKRELKRLSRPAGDFDARRYFRGPANMAFYNVGTDRMRALAKEIYRQRRDTWRVDDAMAFAGILIQDRYLEVKAVGIEMVALYKRDFIPELLPVWKGGLAENHSANWATTDSMCGVLIGPLLVRFPDLIPRMHAWSRHRNMWVRRASIVSLLLSIRRGEALDIAYEIAERLHPEKEDLIHKAVGWVLREAGKVDAVRLEAYLRAKASVIPRTTLRYSIERFPDSKRRELLNATRHAKLRE